MEATDPPQERRLAPRQALVFWAIGVLAVGILVVVHVAAELLLLTFAGLLFGTALRGAAEWCSRHAKNVEGLLGSPGEGGYPPAATSA